MSLSPSSKTQALFGKGTFDGLLLQWFAPKGVGIGAEKKKKKRKTLRKKRADSVSSSAASTPVVDRKKEKDGDHPSSPAVAAPGIDDDDASSVASSPSSGITGTAAALVSLCLFFVFSHRCFLEFSV